MVGLVCQIQGNSIYKHTPCCGLKAGILVDEMAMETVDISALMSTSGKGILYTAAKRFAVEMMNSACNGSAILNCNGIGGDLAPDLCTVYYP